jgi:hypothetical protein
MFKVDNLKWNNLDIFSNNIYDFNLLVYTTFHILMINELNLLIHKVKDIKIFDKDKGY